MEMQTKSGNTEIPEETERERENENKGEKQRGNLKIRLKGLPLPEVPYIVEQTKTTQKHKSNWNAHVIKQYPETTEWK